jgi:restriction endonuclease S subunit
MDSLIGTVPDHWAEYRLDEICAILAGPSTAQINSKERRSTDIPVVMPRDLRNNRIADACAVGVTSEVADELSRYRLLPNDIVCSRTGHLGRQALVSANQRGWLPGSACLRLRAGQLISAPYLVYYLGHPVVQDWIIRNTSGAVIPSLSTKMLGSLPVVVPPTVVQNDTAAILSALDEKIIVHERISRITADLRDAILPRLMAEADPASSVDSPTT